MIRDDSVLKSHSATSRVDRSDRMPPRLAVIMALSVLSWVMLAGLVCIVYFVLT